MQDEWAVLAFPWYKRDQVHNEIRSDNLRPHKRGKTVWEIKNQLLIKKGERHQTYQLHKLENGGIRYTCYKAGKKKPEWWSKNTISPRYHSLIKIKDGHFHSSKNSEIMPHPLRKLLQMLFWHLLWRSWVSFFPVSTTPRVVAGSIEMAKSKNIIYNQPVLESFKKLRS